ncbi:MAG: leucyl/phenylalanyl-tRNA--protein transferase [Campylobacterota bacterium]|nr:leucyl/phenylalanyl-tRNA--protein transferase [Campylobacterota bacterium]
MFDEGYAIAPLGKDMIFPNPRYASTEGLLAFGGDLSPNRLLTAYRRGIFPWYNADDPILWWSPDPRLVLYPNDFKLSKSFRRVLRNGGFTVTFDQRFSEVIRYCGTVPREGQKGTWLVSEMQQAYMELHEMGFAHSVEVYHKGKLVGGLYGVAMGKAFFGESMFSLVHDASKVAFKALSDVLGAKGYDFIDCQITNDHLMRLGATVVPRDRFLDELEESLGKPSDLGLWQHFNWEYENG